MGIARSAVLAFAVSALGSSHLASTSTDRLNDPTMLSRTLEKRDAYTCYGKGAKAVDCQAALEQLQSFENESFEVYSGICLNWSQDTCNVRFCAQPFVTNTVNRTASWIYDWGNKSLMDCVHEGQYSVMGDSENLNGNGGTYRLHLERATPRQG
ncbi:hypothetical protein F4777DRAFT_324059 [Nemania sp. FL0916]|nr:hypothetical protein F4777DRAFT_324059 [Nemania sp. FL0916]